MFDADNDGMISMSELRNMMINFGQKADERELKQIMRVADADRALISLYVSYYVFHTYIKPLL